MHAIFACTASPAYTTTSAYILHLLALLYQPKLLHQPTQLHQPKFVHQPTLLRLILDCRACPDYSVSALSATYATFLHLTFASLARESYQTCTARFTWGFVAVGSCIFIYGHFCQVRFYDSRHLQTAVSSAYVSTTDKEDAHDTSDLHLSPLQ